MTATFKRRMPSGGTLHIEEIQDQVELALMRAGEHKIARDYVIYREEHARLRAEKSGDDPGHRRRVTARRHSCHPGRWQPGTAGYHRINTIVKEACAGLEDVSEAEIIDEALKNLYDGVSQEELSTSLVITARTLIEKEPNYFLRRGAPAAGRPARRGPVLPGRGRQRHPARHEHPLCAGAAGFIERGIELELLAPELADFDLAALGEALAAGARPAVHLPGPADPVRPLLHPQRRGALRAAADLLHARGHGPGGRGRQPHERAIEFYRLLSSFDYMSSTPTLFNAGTLRPQLSSCYLTTVPDDLHGIYGAIQDNAMLSKFAGGLGNDWTPVRALGSYIKGTNGKSQGVVPFLKGRQRHRGSSQPGRQAQGRRVFLPGNLAHGHRGVRRAAQEHRRRPPPHPRHEHRQLDSRPVHEAGVRRRRVDPVLTQRRARPARPVRRCLREAL